MSGRTPFGGVVRKTATTRAAMPFRARVSGNRWPRTTFRKPIDLRNSRRSRPCRRSSCGTRSSFLLRDPVVVPPAGRSPPSVARTGEAPFPSVLLARRAPRDDGGRTGAHRAPPGPGRPGGSGGTAAHRPGQLGDGGGAGRRLRRAGALAVALRHRRRPSGDERPRAPGNPPPRRRRGRRDPQRPGRG